jgi:hypothetical protein
VQPSAGSTPAIVGAWPSGASALALVPVHAVETELSSVGGFGATQYDHVGVASIGPSGAATSAVYIAAAPGLASAGSETIASTRASRMIARR